MPARVGAALGGARGAWTVRRPEDAAADEPNPAEATTVSLQSSAANDDELHVSADDVDDGDNSGERKAMMAALLSSVAVPVAGAAAVAWNNLM